MKKLIMAIAGAVAIWFSACAENESWFNGGIASGWPTAGEGLSGGAWDDDAAEKASWDATAGALVVESEEAEPLVFTATDSKTLGANAQLLSYAASIQFYPFTVMPTAPENAKAGVCIVTNATDGEFFWVLAKDGDESTNVWTKTSVPAVLDAAVPVAISVTKSAEGVGSAVYTLNGTALAAQNVALVGDSAAFSKVAFAGDGNVTTLTGEFDAAVTLKLPNYGENVQTVTVTTNGSEVSAVEGVYNLTIGSSYVVTLTAKDGYLFPDGTNTKVYDAVTMVGNSDRSGETIDPADMPTEAEAKIGTTLYLTLNAAIEAATGDDLIVLQKDISLASQLVVAKKIALDLNGKTINLPPMPTSGWLIGAMKFTADGTVVSNGTIASTATADYALAVALVAYHADVTFKDLTVNAAHYGYGVMANCDGVWFADDTQNYQAMFNQTSAEKKTLVCENVDVTGNGTLFEFEGMKVNLDADCSAKFDDSMAAIRYQAAVYGAAAAEVTIAGGEYWFEGYNALQTGNLGGTIVVNGGSFKGNIKSYMYKGDGRFTGNTATIAIADGTFDGNIVFADDQQGACTKDEVTWNITGGSFKYDPSDYLADPVKAVLKDGWYVVSVPAAKIGTTYYLTLQDAVDAVENDDRIDLCSDVTLAARVEVSRAKTFTINLAGQTIYPTATCGNHSAFNVGVNGETIAANVTITNGTIDATAIPESAGETDAITVRAGATVNLKDGLSILIDTKDGACVYAFKNAYVNIYGGTYDNQTLEDYTWKLGIKGMPLNQYNFDKGDWAEREQLIKVYGGSFRQYNPANGDDSGSCTTFVADGYASVKSGEYWVVTDKAEAKIGTTFYLTLNDALDAATGDDLVELTQSEVTIAKKTIGKDIAINLNGGTLYVNGLSFGSGNNTLKGQYDAVVSNGTIKIAKDQTQATFLVRAYGKSITLVDVEIDATGMINPDFEDEHPTPSWGKRGLYTGAILCPSGDITLKGSTKITNVPAGLNAVSICNYASATSYELGTFNFAEGADAAVEINGNVFIAGGTVRNVDKATFNNTRFILGAGSCEYCTMDTVRGGGFAAMTGTVATAVYKPEGTSYQVQTTGEAFLGLSDALTAVAANKTLTLLKGASASEVATLDKAITLDLNGYAFTVADVDTFTANADLKVVNSIAGEGGLVIAGTVNANGSLNLNDLAYGAGGLVKQMGGALTIGAAGSVKFMSAWDGESANALNAYTTGFFKNTVVGAKVITGNTYTWNGTMFAVNGAVATATVTRNGATFSDSFATLTAAIAAANADTTVTLVDDISTAAAEQYKIEKNLTIDFNGKTITKTVANDWVFTIYSGATAVFQDSTGDVGGIKHYPTQLNQKNPASMIQNKGNLTIKSGKYESDFCIIKNDENPGAGELTVEGGVFTVAAAHAAYTGNQWALMNWATAAIKGGTWTGVIGTRSCDGNAVSKFGTTDVDTAKISGTPTYLLFVGYPKDTTCANFPKIKGVAQAGVTLEKVETITADLALTSDGDYVTVAAQYGVTVAAGIENGTVTVDKAKALAGETITVTATPNEGYTCSEITTNGVALAADETTFVMPAQAVEVGATFELKKYDITFTDAAEWTNVVKTTHGETPVAPDAPEKTGNTFKEWDPAVVAATADATYTAVYTANVYYVTFYTNNVEAAKSYYTYGDKALTYPEIEGVTAWSNENYTAEFTFDGTIAANTQKAYAEIKASSGPTPASGSETKVDPVTDPKTGEVVPDTYKLEPKTGTTTVAVDGVKPTDTLVVDATVTEIGVNNGAEGVTIKVMNSGSTAVVPNGAMKGWGSGEKANQFDTALDATKTVEVETSSGTVNVPVTPTLITETEAEKPLVVGDNVTAKIQAIPGLTYKLIRDDASPAGTFATEAASEVAASGTATITLTDTDKPEGKAFYKVQVTK